MPDRVLVDIEDPQDQLPRRASQERASCWSSDRAGEEPCGRRCSVGLARPHGSFAGAAGDRAPQARRPSGTI